MIQEIPFVILAAGIALVGLWWANFFLDSGIVHWRSRKIGHFFGGCAALFAALLFSTWIWPIILAGTFTLMLGLANRLNPRLFRGVGGAGRGTQALSEMWFPLSMTIVWGIGWGILNKPLEATACILMMAWGDCLTGWVRAFKYKTATKGLEGSLAMFGTSVIIAWAFLPVLWIGILTASGATIVEYICGDVSKIKFLRWADDNLFIPLCSAAIYFGLLYIVNH
jgi:dolichol kinase